MRFLSLERRSRLIEEQYQVKVPANSLALIYTRHGVRYKKTKKATRISEAKEAQLMQERARFARELQGWEARQESVIYMDETTFQLWGPDPSRRTWMSSECVVVAPVN